MLPVLWGCETRSVTLREGQKAEVFENRVLRKILGHEMEAGKRREIY